ncbi:MAG TPA: protein-glutamate O-methyltransferase CheR [Bacteroidales bacterium]|nr:protein-glutamate O-methyltransferase CheR [Bacteroidales bacterium]
MEEVSTNDISRIIEALKTSQGVDFSNYAFSSFRRRVVRFTEINRIRSIDILLEKIINDTSFSDKVIDSITVNVTEMFRDPSFWVMLRDYVFPVFTDKQEIRIWHAACSTGEEVYSMIILLHEAGLLQKSKIIATDLNRNVLRSAEDGMLRKNNENVNNRNYKMVCGKNDLADYYSITDCMIHLDKKLLSNVQFAQHDLTKDDAFGEFDLVLCRNVLIYFNSELQERVLSTINKSLCKGAYLAIGSKESIRWCREYYCFHEESIEEKIYKKINERKPHLY